MSSCHFIEHGENVAFLGPPGVGKSQLALSLGLKAIEHGYRVLFATAAGLMTALTFIVDEIGYLPIDHRAGADLRPEPSHTSRPTHPARRRGSHDG